MLNIVSADERETFIMTRQKKQPRVEIAPDSTPLALSLGALLGREETSLVPDSVPSAERAPDPPPKRELPGRAVLSRETKGRGGKTVTRISFRNGTPGDIAALAKTLRGALGCGGTVDGGDILLQGDQIQRAAEWFAARKVKVSAPR